jgi:hypothetical protein
VRHPPGVAAFVIPHWLHRPHARPSRNASGGPSPENPVAKDACMAMSGLSGPLPAGQVITRVDIRF